MNVETTWQPPHLHPEDYEVAPDLAGFTELISSRIDVAEELTANRALIFRGFGITRDNLDQAIDALLPNRLAYTQGNTPRSKLGENLYTSTEYPASQSISMHNELSYAHKWPSRLLFFCQTAAATGGATSVANGAQWLAALDPEVRDAFGKGVRYTQNLHGGKGLGKSWQQTFETDDRKKVEEFLADGEATWAWNWSGGLRVSQTRSATTQHPETGEEVWFSQVDQWHIAGLPDDVRTFMSDTYTEDQLPQHATFGDGSPIPDEYVLHVRDMGWKHAYDTPWQAGDLLLVDNVLAAHARRPYSGERKILVAMSGPVE